MKNVTDVVSQLITQQTELIEKLLREATKRAMAKAGATSIGPDDFQQLHTPDDITLTYKGEPIMRYKKVQLHTTRDDYQIKSFVVVNYEMMI